MKLISLSLFNFMSYHKSDFIFPDGIIGIVGQYLDDPRKSNGSGKSTIIEAILFAIYGYIRIDGSETELIRIGQEEMKVTLEIEVNQNIVKIIRGRSLKGYELKLYINNIDQSSDLQKETQKKILSTIGLCKSAFEKTLAILQNNGDDLLQSTSGETSKIISSIFGHDFLDYLIKNVRDKKSENSGQMKSLTNILEDFIKETAEDDEETLKEQNKKYIAEIKIIEKEITEKTKEYYNIQKSLEESEKKKQLSNDLTQQIIDAENKIKQLNKEKIYQTNANSNLENTSLKALIDKISNENEKIPAVNEKIISKGKKCLEEIDDIIFKRMKHTLSSPSKTPNCEKDISLMQKELEKIKKEILTKNINEEENKKLKENLLKFTEEINELSKKHVIKKNNLENIKGLNKKCDKCGQEVSKEYVETQTAELNNSIAKILEQIKEKKEKYSKIESEIIQNEKYLEDKTIYENYISFLKEKEKIENRNSTLNQRKNKIRAIINKEEKIQREKSEILLSIEKTKTEIEKVKAEIEKNNIQIKNINTQNKSLEETVLTLNKKIKEIEIIDNSTELKEYSKLQEKIEELTLSKQRIERAKEEKAILLNKIQTNKEKIKQINDNLYKLSKLENYFKALESIYITSRTELVKNTIEQITYHANLILSKISNFNYKIFVNLDTKGKKDIISITIGDGIQNRQYKSFSGGEKVPINLAIHLAMSKLLAGINGAIPKFIFLDEVFAPVDEIGKEGLINVLSFLKEYYDQIFIITHQEGINDIFEKRIIVQKTEFGNNGISSAIIK